MNAGEKIKLSITLDEYESQLLREATDVAISKPEREFERKDYRRMTHLALLAFLRAIIKENRKVGMPVMAELRPETADETHERIADKIPAPPQNSFPSVVQNNSPSALNEAGCFPFHVGLLPETVRALQVVAEKHGMKKRGWPPECWAGLFAIKFALANPKQFSAWIGGIVKYEKLEGLDYDSHASQLVNRNEEYRKKPLPMNWLPFER